jgi:hypothetical protein
MNPKKLAGLSVMDAARTICPGTWCVNRFVTDRNEI